LILLVAATACSSRAGTPTAKPQAADFTLLDLEGKAFKLSDLRGRTVLINFWATWCPPCLAEMPTIEQAYQKHKAEGIMVLAVNTDDPADPQDIAWFVQQFHLTFPTLLDRENRVGILYRVQALPTSFVINKDGVICARHTGPMTLGIIEGYLNAVC
jgi:thiol-disulfide isomerase/thioredoxin